MKADVIILLPVYKSHLDWNEEISFARCIKVLSKRPISICTYQGLDISYYTQKIDAAHIEYSVDYFDKQYFRGTDGYNKLHLSSKFYEHYRMYRYMLVYQLDAYIFEDKLDEWIAKGYDYIGAPWVDEKGKLNGVGNGGFCLKKVNWWYNELRWQLPVWSPKGIISRYPITSIGSFLAFIGRSFGYKNTVHAFYKERRFLYNEDGLPNMIVYQSWRHKPVLPSPEEAMKFGFECQPSLLYKVNSENLPMGCHAWEKYEYETFWKQYIQ